MIGGVTSGSTFRPIPLRTSRAEGVTAADAAPEEAVASAARGFPGSGAERSPEEQDVIRKLQKADTDVRRHEAAHQSAGGPYAGAASFTFQKGPDGRAYAVAGEVSIDISRESTPAATVTKMETVKRAALAPADPSPQDLRVAAQADAIKAQAKAEMRKDGEDAGAEGGTGGAASEASGAPSSALAARAAAAYRTAAASGGGRTAAAAIIA
ncbi:putative metalloprotease CJM1_0395 family protein [Azospirillum halopraeferens]|uniref:putative metalloprotease CJM1_0395 family protein n=1 Tax=Azospirillum halopraeferens TaxID=34010 RepID=UPI0003F74CDD|nr:putative metalloprotease CJM1_0395 family protein [Azospirillum halopraeferens]